MPNPAPKRAVTRCAFKEGGRRCPRNGHGSPPFCRPHQLAMMEAARPRSPVDVITESFVNFLSGKPVNREATIGAAENLYDQWRGMGADYRPDVGAGESESSAHRRARNGQQQQQSWADAFGGQRQARPQVNPEEEALARARAAARQVMGFAAGQVLSGDDIRDRKRSLAKKHHPDRGGSAQKMAAVNDAADVLMAEL